MIINRDIYLNKLIVRKHNHMVKVVTGMRRSGKSYLLFRLFYEHLIGNGIDDEHIIRLNLEDRLNKSLRNPDAVLEYIYGKISGTGMYYVLLDEIQFVAEFEDVLNSLLNRGNVDVYVTGSNAKFLSKDVITEFRGRGDEVRVHPLSFKEYFSVGNAESREQALLDYMTYGGLPQTTTMLSSEQKEDYLKTLFVHTYITDIKERYRIKNDADLEELIDLLASSIGGLVNPTKLQNTFKTVKRRDVSYDTIKNYLDMLQDAFVVEKAVRYDIKGKRYIDTPTKYYFEDLGLRNARINFRQAEQTHLMENLIYNELRIRGLSVDVGEVVVNTKDENGVSRRKNLEVDFVCNRGFRRCYIQSALALPTPEKMEQECASLRRITDSFQKIVIVGGLAPTYQTDDGILILNIFDFLLDEGSVYKTLGYPELG